MSIRTFFSLSYPRDIKALPGFVKGGRDKVPKESSDYAAAKISGWSEKEIKEHIEDVATKSKNILEISARNFKTPSYDLGTGGFDCPFFTYDFSVRQSEEDLDRCLFTGLLEVKNIQTFHEIQNVIDSCFNFSFDKIFCLLPKEERDLKELIYTLDDNKKLLMDTFEFSYENDFSSFQLTHLKDRRVITVDDKKVEIQFRASESIPEMIEALRDVNKKIYSATAEEYKLLDDR